MQVPIEFLYRGLTYFKVYELAHVYEPVGLARPLRTGATEEVAKLGKSIDLEEALENAGEVCTYMGFFL